MDHRPSYSTALTRKFEAFYRQYYHGEIGLLVQHYSNDRRSLSIKWSDLNRFDPDMADDYRAETSASCRRRGRIALLTAAVRPACTSGAACDCDRAGVL